MSRAIGCIYSALDVMQVYMMCITVEYVLVSLTLRFYSLCPSDSSSCVGQTTYTSSFFSVRSVGAQHSIAHHACPRKELDDAGNLGLWHGVPALRL